jgi:hypothetical protein
MPRFRDPANDPVDPHGPNHGPEDYNVHEQGYEGRPIDTRRGSLDTVEPPPTGGPTP